MPVSFSLSISDLLLVDGFSKAFSENDTDKINKILYDNGMDVYNGLTQEVFCNHRNLQGDVVECIRYENVERQDREWLESGCASWENIVESSNDPSLRAELKWIGRQGSCDRTWQDNNVAKRVAKSEQGKGV